MREKGQNKNIQKIFLFDKDELSLFLKAVNKFKTYEAEIVREALKDFYKKHEIE